MIADLHLISLELTGRDGALFADAWNIASSVKNAEQYLFRMHCGALSVLGAFGTEVDSTEASLLGVAQYQLPNADTQGSTFLNMIAVREDVQGNGIASVILSSIEGEARKLRSRGIVMEIGDDSTKLARFYGNRGYRRAVCQSWIKKFVYEQPENNSLEV